MNPPQVTLPILSTDKLKSFTDGALDGFDVFKNIPFPHTAAYLTDLGSAPGPVGTISRRLYLQNPGSSPIEVQARYFSSSGFSAQHLYSIPAGGLATVDVGQELQMVPSGAVGAELRLTSGAGGFMAVSIGRTADGRSAYEEAAIPAY